MYLSLYEHYLVFFGLCPKYIVDDILLQFPFNREGFRSRQEAIVRIQASSNSDTSPGDPGIDFSNDEIQHGIQVGIQAWDSDQLQSRIQNDEVNEFTNNTINGPVEAPIDVSTGEDDIQRENWLEQVTEDERINLPELNSAELDPWRENTQANTVSDWQETSGNARRQTAHINYAEDGSALPSQQTWPNNSSRTTLGSWGPSNPSRIRRNLPIRRVNRFHPPDDDNVYSMELRELLSRYAFSGMYTFFFPSKMLDLNYGYPFMIQEECFNSFA